MFLLTLLLGLIGTTLAGGIWLAKRQDQKVRDHNRKTYRLSFPADLSPEQVIVWLRSISGTLRGGKLNLTGKPTLAFETFATSSGITHRLKVPFGAEPYVVPQLRLAGINATPEEEFEDRDWANAVEVGITQSGRQLRIYDPADISTSLLATMQSFNSDEALIVQLVITPAAPVELPIHDKANSLDYANAIRGYKATKDEVHDRREKLEEPNFLAVLRVAGAAKTDAAARNLVERVRMSLTAIRGPKIKFHKRLVTMNALRDRIAQATGPVVFPMQLSAPELSALIAWPMGRPMVAGLAPVMARHLAPSATIPSDGLVLGRSTMPGAERPVGVSYANAVRHLYSVGGSGCLHPDTPIYDPVAKTTLTVKRRQELGEPFHVFALDGQEIKIASAAPPVRYRRVGMYELYNAETTITVTGQHRVWNGTSYVEVGRLYYQQISSAVQLPSISEHGLSRLLVDAQNLTRTHVDSLAGHLLGCRLCEGLSLTSPSVAAHNALLFSNYSANSTFRVRPASADVYYDFHVPTYENYLAQGVFHHNSGKSVLLTNMGAQVMQQNHGLIMIDAKSDKDALFYRLLRVIPTHRLDDVIIVDVTDSRYPVGFNILDQGDKGLSISQISKLITEMYADRSQSITAPRVLHHSLHALAEAGNHTFVDLPALLDNFPDGSAEREWQDWVVRNVKGHDTKLFMQRLMNMSRSERDRLAGPVFNRIWEFTDPPAVRRILGQRVSSFKMADVIRDNKILLIYVDSAQVGPQAASLLGTLFVQAIWDAVQIVQASRPNFLFLDEFADFIGLPIGIESMLAKARGSNLSLVMAHQNFAQLRPELRDTVLHNTATQIYFAARASDAHAIAREIPGKMATAEDLQTLPRYTTLSTIATDSGTSPPVTVGTFPEPRDTGNAQKARQLSRERYGRPYEQVDRDIMDRRPGTEGHQRRRPPRISGEGWS